jgi:hypothetical protein
MSAAKEDILSTEAHTNEIFSMIPGAKFLHWVEGPKPDGSGEYMHRCDAYNYWNDNSDMMM